MGPTTCCCSSTAGTIAGGGVGTIPARSLANFLKQRIGRAAACIARFEAAAAHEAARRGLAVGDNAPAAAKALGVGALVMMTVLMIAAAGSTLDSTFASLSKVVAQELPAVAGRQPPTAALRYGTVAMIVSPIPSPHPSLCGVMVRGIHLDALAVPFDADRWEQEFLANWPPESPAYRSYFSRIVHGPDYTLEQVYTAVPRQDAAPATL